MEKIANSGDKPTSPLMTARPQRNRWASFTVDSPAQMFLEILLVLFLGQAVLIALSYAVSSQSILDIVVDSVLLALVTVGLLYKLVTGPLRAATRKARSAEQLLSASGQMYRTLFESSSDAIVIAHSQGELIGGNPSAVTLFGCKDSADLCSARWADLSPEKQPDGLSSPDKLRAKTKAALEHGPQIFDWSYQRKDGSRFLAAVQLTATRMGGRKLIQATIRDVTDQKNLEIKFNEHVREIDCLYGLSKLTEQPGIVPAELYQKAAALIRDAYHNPDRVCVRLTFEGVHYGTENFAKTERSQFAEIRIAGEQAGAIEVYFLGQESPELTFLPYERNMLDAVAVRLGLFAERIRSAEKLQLFRNLIDRSNDSIFIVDPKWGRLLDVNERACETLHYSREELLGMTLADIVPSLQGEASWRAYGDKLHSQQSMTCDMSHRCKDGSTFPVEATVRVIKRENDSFIVAVARDITERKKAAEQQTHLLRQVESVNQELKDFAYIVSHDLKAPLRGIKALTDWLAADYSDKFDEDGKEQMRLLVSRVNRMHNLIDGVLQYSRVGRVCEEHVAVELNSLLPEIIDMLAAPEHIKITVEANLPAVVCERTRIQQVFQNLLSNAIKYMDKPQGIISVGSEDEGAFWKFHVTDNGPGIEEQHFERIFKIFQTLQARDEFESTGVGLTLVKKIVELYGGKVWLESKVGQGTTFLFTLPKQPVAAQVESTTAGQGA